MLQNILNLRFEVGISKSELGCKHKVLPPQPLNRARPLLCSALSHMQLCTLQLLFQYVDASFL